MHRVNMALVTVGTNKVYGPLSIEDQYTVQRLPRSQVKYIYENYNGAIAVITKDRREFGIWAESTCTR